MVEYPKRIARAFMWDTFKNAGIAVVWSFATVVTGAEAQACEPCHAPTVKEAYAQADLVVIARRVSPAPGSKSQGGLSCPVNDPKLNFTEIDIQRVLKGTLELHRVAVPACYGMCDYGLILTDSESRLIFLHKSSEPGVYETLKPCKAPEPLVRDDQVQVDDRWLPLEEGLGR